jgi:hypothetical protein
VQLSKEIDEFDRATKDFERVPELAEVRGKHIAESSKRVGEVRVKVA